MLINLVPDFLAVLADADREAAWHQYFESHSAILTAYWRNYVLEPGSPAAAEVVRNALAADRSDLHALLAGVDVVRVVEETLARAEDVLQIDRPTDCYLMVGMGGANAGELVVGGRGVAFICLEHFTARANPQTYGLGPHPRTCSRSGWPTKWRTRVRYTSPASRSDLRRLVAESGGYYDYWETGRRATLRELLVNEGLAVRAAEAVAPGFRLSDYFGYTRRQYDRLRELEAFLSRAVAPDLDRLRARAPAPLPLRRHEPRRPPGPGQGHPGAERLLPRPPHDGGAGTRPRHRGGAPGRGGRGAGGGRRGEGSGVKPVVITIKPSGSISIEGEVVIQDRDGNVHPPPGREAPRHRQALRMRPFARTHPFCDGTHNELTEKPGTRRPG